MSELLARMRNSPFLSLLGVEIVDAPNEPATIRLTVKEELLQSLGVAHGGVAGTMIDTVIGVAAGRTLKEPAAIVTVEYKVSFYQPSRLGDVLTARGELLNAGRQTFSGVARVTNQHNQLVAAGMATYMRVAGAP